MRRNHHRHCTSHLRQLSTRIEEGVKHAGSATGGPGLRRRMRSVEECGVVQIFLFATILFAALNSAEAYKVVADVDHFQLDRNFCEEACYTSAETRVEANPGEAVEFYCRTDREHETIRKLWTTDGGKYVATNGKSFLERYSVANGGSTLRIKPVTEDDDQKSLWCSLLLYDEKQRRWRPRKTIHHFLYVGEGKMKLTSQDLMNLDIKDENVLYHHRKIDELDSAQKSSGNISISNVSVENIFFNGTMEKDNFYEDVETEPNGAKGGNVKEEKEFIDLGEKFRKTIEDDLPAILERKMERGEWVPPKAAFLVRQATNDAPSVAEAIDWLWSNVPSPALTTRYMNNFLYISTPFLYVMTLAWISWMLINICRFVEWQVEDVEELAEMGEEEKKEEAAMVALAALALVMAMASAG